MAGLVSNPLARDELIERDFFEGVRLIRLPQARDARGAVTKLWQKSFGCPLLGEVYLSSVNPGAVKGWHLHRIMTLRYVCVSGAVMVALHDRRYGAVGSTVMVILSDGEPPWTEHHKALIVPPGIANGFRTVHDATVPATVLNLANLPHDPSEIERIPLEDIPFDWGAYEISG